MLILSLQRFRTATGERSEQVADSLCYIGQLEDDLGEYATSEVTLRKALSIQNSLPQPQPIKIALVEMLLARDLLKMNNRLEEALDLLKLSEPMSSGDSESVASRFNNVNLQAIANLHLHRYSEAERLAQWLVSSDRRQHTNLRPADAEDLLLLGEVREAQGHVEAAEKAHAEALRVDERWMPKGQQDVAEARRLLAQVLVEEGSIREADPMASEALRDLEHYYGDSHRRVAYAWRVMGKIAQARRRWSKARSAFAREIAIYRKTGNRGELPPALTDLGDVDTEAKDFRGVKAAYEEALAIFPETEWAGEAQALHAQKMLANVRACIPPGNEKMSWAVPKH